MGKSKQLYRRVIEGDCKGIVSWPFHWLGNYFVCNLLGKFGKFQGKKVRYELKTRMSLSQPKQLRCECYAHLILPINYCCLICLNPDSISFLFNKHGDSVEVVFLVARFVSKFVLFGKIRW